MGQDQEAEAARHQRVSEQGWRSPLTKTYVPLGTPRLVVERKPDWALALAAAERERQARKATSTRPVFLGLGESKTASVPKFGWAHYHTSLSDPKACLCIKVEALSGDPDLYVSREDGSGITHPTPVDCTWSSFGSGADKVEITPSDPHFGVGTYWISVYGGGGGEATSFTVSVATRKQQVLVQMKG